MNQDSKVPSRIRGGVTTFQLVSCPLPRASGVGLARRRAETPTLNTSVQSGHLYKVLSVGVFNLHCVSTFSLSRCTALYTNDDLYNRPSKVELVTAQGAPCQHAGGMTVLSEKRRARAYALSRSGCAASMDWPDDNNCGWSPQDWRAADRELTPARPETLSRSELLVTTASNFGKSTPTCCFSRTRDSQRICPTCIT